MLAIARRVPSARLTIGALASRKFGFSPLGLQPSGFGQLSQIFLLLAIALGVSGGGCHCGTECCGEGKKS